ncbi:MAG: hypothetical protein HY984_02120 [Candidatus Magasanikbacteria bacterium]|nr:hypothetical protein [Candidatus Magasanikbacteria bacterium]
MRGETQRQTTKKPKKECTMMIRSFIVTIIALVLVAACATPMSHHQQMAAPVAIGWVPSDSESAAKKFVRDLRQWAAEWQAGSGGNLPVAVVQIESTADDRTIDLPQIVSALERELLMNRIVRLVSDPKSGADVEFMLTLYDNVSGRAHNYTLMLRVWDTESSVTLASVQYTPQENAP